MEKLWRGRGACSGGSAAKVCRCLILLWAGAPFYSLAGNIKLKWGKTERRGACIFAGARLFQIFRSSQMELMRAAPDGCKKSQPREDPPAAHASPGRPHCYSDCSFECKRECVHVCVYIFRLSSHKKIQATRRNFLSAAVTRSSLVPACCWSWLCKQDNVCTLSLRLLPHFESLIPHAHSRPQSFACMQIMMCGISVWYLQVRCHSGSWALSPQTTHLKCDVLQSKT